MSRATRGCGYVGANSDRRVSDNLSRLARYQTSAENSYYRAPRYGRLHSPV
jgi:hypothetical protein